MRLYEFAVAALVCARTLDWANEIQLLGGCPHLLQYLELFGANVRSTKCTLSHCCCDRQH